MSSALHQFSCAKTTVTANAIVSQICTTVIVNSVLSLIIYLALLKLDIVLECDLEETDHPAPTSTMNVRIFSPDRKTDEFLVLEKVSESRLEWKYHGSVKL